MADETMDSVVATRRFPEVPGGICSHISGVDTVHAGAGEYYVLEDNPRVPSGVSCMIENRCMMMRLFPELSAAHALAPVEHSPDLLHDVLRSVAPDARDEPTVAVLTPGFHNSAARTARPLPPQYGGEAQRLFLIYAVGNFIEASHGVPFFQNGGTGYGKPVIDRVLTESIGLDDAVKLMLVSFDSTMRSSILAGLLIDLLVCPVDSLDASRQRRIDEAGPYFRQLGSPWNESLKRALAEIPTRKISRSDPGGLHSPAALLSRGPGFLHPARLRHGGIGDAGPARFHMPG